MKTIVNMTPSKPLSGSDSVLGGSALFECSKRWDGWRLAKTEKPKPGQHLVRSVSVIDGLPFYAIERASESGFQHSAYRNITHFWPLVELMMEGDL